MVRHNLPCQPASLCPNWVLSPVQVFGPITNLGFAQQHDLGPTPTGVTIAREWAGGRPDRPQRDLARGGPEATLVRLLGVQQRRLQVDRAAVAGDRRSSRKCSSRSPNAAADDYRLSNGVGVDWAPAEQQYGP